MKENITDLQELQTLLNESIEKAGDFLRRSFEMPEHSLTAAQLICYLRGQITLAMASVTSKQAPRVAPVGALFYRGRFYIPTVAEAARTRQLARNAQVSLTHYQGNDLAVIVHGQAVILRENHAYFSILEELHRECNEGNSIRDWNGEPVFIRIEPDVQHSYARYPEKYPEIEL